MTNTTTSPGKKPIVLITGASGLIGKHLIQRLSDRYQCIGLDAKGDTTPDARVENISMDIADSASVEAALGRVRHAYGSDIASVVHLAAYYDFAGEPSPLYEKVTVKGTETLLRALLKFKVEQFVFSSTNLVYKPSSPGEKINEEWPLEPMWDYPESKVRTEKIIHDIRGNIPVVVLRIAGVYSSKGNSIPISNQIQRIYEKTLTSHFYPGDLMHGSAFVHLDDLTDAIARTVEKRYDLPGEITMNISEPGTFSYDELQDEIGELVHGKEWKTFEIPKPVAKAGAWAQDVVGDSFIKPWMIDRADDHFEMDISRARKYLDWQPKHNLKETLPSIIASLKADPDNWYKENKLEK